MKFHARGVSPYIRDVTSLSKILQEAIASDSYTIIITFVYLVSAGISSRSLRWRHATLCISDAALPTPVPSFSSVDSPLSSPITLSFFHTRLKTYVFHKLVSS